MKHNREEKRKNGLENKEKNFLVLIYANWLNYSINLKEHFKLNEENLIDIFIPLEIEEIIDLDTKKITKKNIYSKNDVINEFILNQIKKINSIPVIILFQEKENKISKEKIIIPTENIEQIENKIKYFIEGGLKNQ